MTSNEFIDIGNSYTKTLKTECETTRLRRFKSFFGVTPQVCAIVWEQVKQEAPVDSKPKHLLWSLNFLRQYSVEHNRKSVFQADEKTIRKWTCIFIKLLSNLNTVNWDNRFLGAVDGQTCFCSLDGVDFRIMEPTPFSPRWYSHKFNGPGLRYEIGLNIRKGLIVWKHGEYPCGQFSDLSIAREAYVLSVNKFELTLADRIYKDRKYFILRTATNKKLHKLIMTRHETVNKRIKQFRALKEQFRHDLTKHPMVFHAIVNLTQLNIENGEPLFRVI